MSRIEAERTESCSMSERDGKDQRTESPRQACLWWFAWNTSCSGRVFGFFTTYLWRCLFLFSLSFDFLYPYIFLVSEWVLLCNPQKFLMYCKKRGHYKERDDSVVRDGNRVPSGPTLILYIPPIPVLKNLNGKKSRPTLFRKSYLGIPLVPRRSFREIPVKNGKVTVIRT